MKSYRVATVKHSKISTVIPSNIATVNQTVALTGSMDVTDFTASGHFKGRELDPAHRLSPGWMGQGGPGSELGRVAAVVARILSQS